MKSFVSVVIMLVLLVGFGGTCARAASEPQRLISASEAISRAQAQYDGKILSVELVNAHGDRPFYRIKMIQNGKIRVVQIDARK